MNDSFKKNGYVIINSKSLECSTIELSKAIVNFIKNAEISIYAYLFAGGTKYSNIGEWASKAYELGKRFKYIKMLLKLILYTSLAPIWHTKNLF